MGKIVKRLVLIFLGMIMVPMLLVVYNSTIGEGVTFKTIKYTKEIKEKFASQKNNISHNEQINDYLEKQSLELVFIQDVILKEEDYHVSGTYDILLRRKNDVLIFRHVVYLQGDTLIYTKDYEVIDNEGFDDPTGLLDPLIEIICNEPIR